MVVVAIIGIVLAAGVPALDAAYRKEGFRKTISDVNEVCIATRKQAILGGEKAEMVFHPTDRTLEGGGKSIKFDDSTEIEMLDVNLLEYKQAEAARVRFFPNGTSDEMTLILHSTTHNERRKISLEITTGLADVTDKLE